MELELLDELNDRHIRDLAGLYQNEWWTVGREENDVARAVRGSDVVLAIHDRELDLLVGFVRVLTDFVYRAKIYDVIVARSHRGRGLGRRLMDLVVSHPRLVGVENMELDCLEEMVPFYEKWGFASGREDGRNLRSLSRAQSPV